MEAIKIEILNPKALKLIKGMQELDLIRVSGVLATRLKIYLKKMRKQSATAPSPDEIAKVVKEVRGANNAKK